MSEPQFRNSATLEVEMIAEIKRLNSRDGILAGLRAISADARVALFREFCRDCGGLDPKCHCGNDE